MAEAERSYEKSDVGLFTIFYLLKYVRSDKSLTSLVVLQYSKIFKCTFVFRKNVFGIHSRKVLQVTLTCWGFFILPYFRSDLEIGHCVHIPKNIE